LRQTLVRLWRGKVLRATSLSSALHDNWTWDISKTITKKSTKQLLKGTTGQFLNWQSLSVVVLWEYECLSPLLSLSVPFPSQLCLNVPCVVSTGIYNLPTCRDVLIGCLQGPTLPKYTDNPHPDFPSNLCVLLATSRAERRVLLSVPVSNVGDKTVDFPGVTGRCWGCVESHIGCFPQAASIFEQNLIHSFVSSQL